MRARREGCGDGMVFPALCRFKQYTGARHFASRVGPAVQESFELFAFLIRECDAIFFWGIAGHPPVHRLTRLYLIYASSIKFAVMEY